MPAQQQMASFASRLGARVAEANAEHADKPVDTGNRRLPPGIRDGVARLSAMYTKEYEEGDFKGQVFFRASAVVISPAEHNGEKVAGLVTSKMIPLCEQPAKQGSQRRARSFSDNWFDFQNLFKMLGVFPPDGKDGRPDYTDRAMPDRVAAGKLIEAYYFAAMKTLTDPVRMKTNPVYISFSTRGWTPPATTAQPKPEEMVFEEWHGLANAEQARPDPAAGVTAAPSGNGPAPMAPPAPDHQPTRPPSAPYENPTTAEEMDQADVIASLVDEAMNDPEGATEEGAAASAQLEEMAWAAGWTKEQTAGAADWAAVGDMALNPPDVAPPTSTTQGTVPTPSPNGVVPGSRWMFAKRTKEGAKLKNNKGEEFPPQEVEVVTVDPAAKTCTVKNAKDGKDVVDIRSKQPIAVKWEWLEAVPY